MVESLNYRREAAKGALPLALTAGGGRVREPAQDAAPRPVFVEEVK